MDSSAEHRILEDELVLMESVYPAEFEFLWSSNVDDPVRFHAFTMDIHPSTAGDTSLQNISVTLRLLLPAHYPVECPEISFHRPRGLSELQLVALSQHLEAEASKRIGAPMIYDLVDIVKDYLTQTNFPTVECPFCLCDITEDDKFYKTPCFHYYHTYCLNGYLKFLRTENNMECLKNCIVCREPLPNVLGCESKEKPCVPRSLQNSPEKCALSEKLIKDRLWREELFTKQQNQKGIIVPDKDADFVITLQHTPEVLRMIQESSQGEPSESSGSIFSDLKISI
ncbi:E3 ubiquitin-protein ligase RNF25-like [Paramacrobiotus metropolitanus]|uniref:E3 ubiquitin-protein ligase RNF25-like n=1 Tax=Paramacrobiotus metropolitanus TaxID=2943436 RepID=UPI002445751B|nr:E3 ubiquitin-protein ligase RNF25-like [Paramacrobiotus metropolitanus]